MSFEVYVLLKMHPFSGKFLKPTVAGAVAFGIISFAGPAVLDLHGLKKVLIYTPMFLIMFTSVLCLLGIDAEDRFIINYMKTKLKKVIK